jgi:hypothetical protein
MRGALFAPPYAQHGEGDHRTKIRWWRGQAATEGNPSTMFHMVPLPTGFAGREELS